MTVMTTKIHRGTVGEELMIPGVRHTWTFFTVLTSQLHSLKQGVFAKLSFLSIKQEN